MRIAFQDGQSVEFSSCSGWFRFKAGLGVLLIRALEFVLRILWSEPIKVFALGHPLKAEVSDFIVDWAEFQNRQRQTTPQTTATPEAKA